MHISEANFKYISTKQVQFSKVDMHTYIFVAQFHLHHPSQLNQKARSLKHFDRL